MKKALLTTIFKVPNFGSVLQAYATQAVLEMMGVACFVLNYDHNNSKWARDHGVKGVSAKSRIAKWLGVKPIHRKKRKLQSFIDKYFHLTSMYRSFEDIKTNEGSDYDIYIAGSDQIWNTKYTNCDPIFLLRFVSRSNKKRISIASSFACDKLDANYEEVFKKELGTFDGISVREIKGQKVLRNIGIAKSHIVLDPTLLLNCNQWNKLAVRPDKAFGNYILLYMWSYAFEPRPYIYDVLKYYKAKMNCQIIALEGYDSNDTNQRTLEVLDATDSSIADFLGYFANAALVVTSSFHGTAFAVNYGVPLISIVPSGGDDRQSSLLEQLDLSFCRLTVGEIIEHANPFYDREAEQQRLEMLREDSLKWIKKQL